MRDQIHSLWRLYRLSSMERGQLQDGDPVV
jgi:hypothetical protein